MVRESTVGPSVPQSPFPVVIKTQIINGFGRGSSELGIPTANIPPGELSELEPGVYYGWAHVSKYGEVKTENRIEKEGSRQVEFNYGHKLKPEDQEVFPMVMSIGWNPFYNNTEKSAEVHIMHKFTDLFYGASIGVVVAGFIRSEQSYDSLDALVADIKFDMVVAKNSLDREAYQKLKLLIA